MPTKIEEIIAAMQKNAAEIPEPVRNKIEDHRLEEALKRSGNTMLPETKKYYENLVTAKAYADAQLQMEYISNVAHDLNKEYPIKDGEYYLSFLSNEDLGDVLPFKENEHPAIKHIGCLSLQAADKFISAMNMQALDNMIAIKNELESKGETDIENNPRYKAWNVPFSANYAIYNSENNVVDRGVIYIGNQENQNQRESGLFESLLQSHGEWYQYYLDQEKIAEQKRIELLEKKANGINVDIDLGLNKESLEEIADAKKEIRDGIQKVYKLREQCYGTEIPKELSMEIPDSIIPWLTGYIDKYEGAQQEKERLDAFSVGDHVRCSKNGNVYSGNIINIETIIDIPGMKERAWTIQLDNSEKTIEIEENTAYDYILNKEETTMEKTKETQVIVEEKVQEKAGKTVSEKYLEDQEKLVNKIAKYVERNNELPWNADAFPKKVAQENGEKSTKLLYDSQDPSKAAYSELNQLKLSMAAMEKGYTDNRWVTRDYVLKNGGYILRGEKAEKVFTSVLPNEIANEPKVVKYHNVFNVKQTGMLPMPPVREEPVNNKIRLINDIIEQKPELQKEVNENQTQHDKYGYANILHNLSRGVGVSAKPGPDLSKDATPEKVREEIVAEISSAFLKQTFKSNVSEKERPNKLDPKVAVDYLKAHPDELGAICREANTNRINAIVYLKTVNKELTEAKEKAQVQAQEKAQEKTQEAKQEKPKAKTATKKKEKKQDRERER